MTRKVLIDYSIYARKEMDNNVLSKNYDIKGDVYEDIMNKLKRVSEYAIEQDIKIEILEKKLELTITNNKNIYYKRR